MKTVISLGLLATSLASAAFAHGSATGPDAAAEICDPVFARLEARERGLLLAQAEPAKSGSSSGEPATNEPAKTGQNQPTEEELTKQLSALLQACSFDGRPITVSASALAASDAQGVEAVDQIMRFTGLPQNFRVMRADVPNAAAMIVLDKDNVPQRVIAYNAEFMKAVGVATDANGWANLSILAHEIGHHLSGHTLLSGGSQPPTELEADKFSGFVLYKMGATKDDAELAVLKLASDKDSATHPGKPKRLKAIAEGWSESCLQQNKDCAATTVATPAAPPASGAAAITTQGAGPAGMPDIPGPAEIRIPGKDPALSDNRNFEINKVPDLAAETPSKFDRFVYDEVGVIHPDIRSKLERLAYDYAAWNSVEIVTIVANDLRGLSPDDYAARAMRQLRVGKMDIGNGAVIVIAPEHKQAGLALGPGLLVKYENTDALRKALADYFRVVEGGGDPVVASDIIAGAAYAIMRQARDIDWTIRFDSLKQWQDAEAAFQAQLKQTGEKYDPARSPTLKRLVRMEGRLVSKTPDAKDASLAINEPRSRHVGPAMQVRTADGQNVIVYAHPSVAALMTAPLEEGKTYSFVARGTILSGATPQGTTPQMDLISYDLLDAR